MKNNRIYTHFEKRVALPKEFITSAVKEVYSFLLYFLLLRLQEADVETSHRFHP